MVSDYGCVSIIMAAYNSEKWINETIECVQAQTYSNWELLITDDCSTDNTVELARNKAIIDSRIKVFVNAQNCGAGITRNNSLSHATGRFIAFLDSDDLWTNDKLELQLEYMIKNAWSVCYTSYDLINEFGEFRKTIIVPAKVTYDSYLKRPITCTHSICFDTNIVDKTLLEMPNIRRGQDGATWLKVLKTGIVGHGIVESLAKYRRHEGSLSNNKLKAIKRIWFLYRKVEKLPLHYACICFVSYAINAIKKYS